MKSKLFLSLSLLIVAFSSTQAFNLSTAKTACVTAAQNYTQLQYDIVSGKFLWGSRVVNPKILKVVPASALRDAMENRSSVMNMIEHDLMRKAQNKTALVLAGLTSSAAAVAHYANKLSNTEVPAPMTKWEKVKASAKNAKTYVSDKSVQGLNFVKTSAKTGYTFAANHPKSSAAVATAVVAGLGYAAYSYYNSNNAVVVSAPEVKQEEVKAPAVRTGGPARRAVRKAVQA